jgi:hypothetical protein
VLGGVAVQVVHTERAVADGKAPGRIGVRAALVPAAALARVGQLATLRVRGSAGWGRRYVSVGATRSDGRIEVLAGLSGGETIGWDGE